VRSEINYFYLYFSREVMKTTQLRNTNSSLLPVLPLLSTYTVDITNRIHYVSCSLTGS
jgi:hypothetical protein